MGDNELAGRVYDPLPVYAVEKEKLREFARAVGVENPVYFSQAAAAVAGYPDLPAVPTFAAVFLGPVTDQLLADKELDIAYDRVVHGEQSFAYARPIFAGDQLVVQGRLAAVRTLGAHRQITLEANLSTPEGEAIATMTSTLIVRGEE